MVLSLIITPAVHFFATGGREESATANGSQNGASTFTTPSPEGVETRWHFRRLYENKVR